MERAASIVRPQSSQRSFSEQLHGEVVRKALHLLIAFVPLLASLDLEATMALLGAGTLFYLLAEKLRLDGLRVYLISDLTVIASRERDRGRFVVGPVTLGLGAMLALLLYPSTAAAIAIYALAFGDGFASLVGRLVGRLKLPCSGGKTLAGTLACFAAVLVGAWKVSGSLPAALIIALTATLLELLPVGDFDNLLIPVGTGFVATALLYG